MLIRLEFAGTFIHEIRTAELKQDIGIGRSKKCAWPVPPEDAVISGHHANLTRKGKAVWFIDLESKNGSYYRGKRIEKRRLRAGDRISLGDCVLVVEREDQAAEAATGTPSIIVRTGKTRGQRKDIKAPGIKIGSDPASDLLLLDTLVSRHHAEISLKEDASCWIKDLGSKNGTSVNGLPLRTDKERMLKDCDTIAIAHLEMEFHDGSRKHASGQAWLRMGIMAATLVAALILYWAYQRVRPPARHFIAEAARLAAAEDFKAAEEALVKATGARNLASHRLEVEDMKRLLGVWDSTTSLWRQARDALVEGNWVNASRDLGMLQARKKEAWGWSPDALLEKDKVLEAKSMLDALLSARGATRRDNIEIDELRRNLKAVEASLASGASADYHQKMREELAQVRSDVEKLIREGRGLEDALDKLSAKPPPFEDIILAIRGVKDSAGGALRHKATLIHDAVVGLGLSFARHASCADKARDLQFKEALGVELELPSVDACAIDSRVSAARTALETSFDSLKTSVVQLSYLQEQIVKLMDTPDAAIPKALRLWRDPAVMAKVFACDAFEGSLPTRSRKIPSGEYDRLLGVEEFYYTLSILPEPADSSFIEQMPIRTVLTQARQLVKRIAAFNQFLDQPENKWLVYGNLGKLLTRYESILKERDTIVAEMVSKLQGKTNREALIAGGVALALSGDPKALTVDGASLEMWLVKTLKTLRAGLAKLNSDYSAAPPAQAIEIRRQVLGTGLPGDPIVRRMWASRDASGGE